MSCKEDVLAVKEQQKIPKVKKRTKEKLEIESKKRQQRAKSVLAKLTSNEVADETFEAIIHNKKPKRVGSIKPESTSKLSKCLHLDSLAWLLGTAEVFDPKLATGLQDVLAILKESSGKGENEANDSNDVDSDHNLHYSYSEHNSHNERAPTDKKRLN